MGYQQRVQKNIEVFEDTRQWYTADPRAAARRAALHCGDRAVCAGGAARAASSA